MNEHLESEEFNVFVLGHSCGISDRLILKQIFSSKGVYRIIPFYYKDRSGYFQTMVNIDRIIDDYSKSKEEKMTFKKLFPFPKSYKMPQREHDDELKTYLSTILNDLMPKEKKSKSQSDFFQGLSINKPK